MEERYYTIQIEQKTNNENEINILFFNEKVIYKVDLSKCSFITKYGSNMSNMDFIINELNKIGYNVCSYTNMSYAIMSKKESFEYDQLSDIEEVIPLLDSKNKDRIIDKFKNIGKHFD